MKPDRDLILELNKPLPITAKPFITAARRLGWNEGRLIKTIKAYKKRGLIRRFGLVLAHRNIGLKANVLVAWDVPGPEIERAAGIFCRAVQVSHCYQRRRSACWPYNVYTMIHGKNKKDCRDTVKTLSRGSGVKDYRELFTLKEFKKTKADIWRILK